jgi:hypothetical protein
MCDTTTTTVIPRAHARTHAQQVERTMAKMGEVRNTMAILLAVEGCGLFLAATVYVCLLVRRVSALTHPRVRLLSPPHDTARKEMHTCHGRRTHAADAHMPRKPPNRPRTATSHATQACAP